LSIQNKVDMSKDWVMESVSLPDNSFEILKFENVSSRELSGPWHHFKIMKNSSDHNEHMFILQAKLRELSRRTDSLEGKLSALEKHYDELLEASLCVTLKPKGDASRIDALDTLAQHAIRSQQ
jgi:hypothetical protein